jgi:type VI secretion system protein ImpL
LGDWVGNLSAGVDLLAVNTARTSMQSAWQAEGARVCAAAIDGRYPFDRKATREVAMDDFVRVFGPKGVFETFFADNKLAEVVDTTANPWGWKGAFGKSQGRASDALAQFGRARQIRQAFFSSSDQPSIRVTITPETLDQSSTAVQLEVQGEKIVYVPGHVVPKTIWWPAREKVSLTRLTFQPGGYEEALSLMGPWSTMRLFYAAEKTQLSDDRFRARFTRYSHFAVFEIQVGSILNPFTTDVLSAFRCPDKW